VEYFIVYGVYARRKTVTNVPAHIFALISIFGLPTKMRMPIRYEKQFTLHREGQYTQSVNMTTKSC